LSRHIDKIAIDKKVCFYRQLFTNPIKPRRTNTDPVGPLGALMGWSVVLNCFIQCLLAFWYGQGCCGYLSGPLCTQPGWLCLLASITHPPTPSTLATSLPPNHLFICGTCDIAGCVQNISQNQPVHRVAIYVNVMIAISLLCFCCKSCMATIKHKELIILLIFQICISQNPGKYVHGWFSKIRSQLKIIYTGDYIGLHLN